jgi:hypothetical protein
MRSLKEGALVTIKGRGADLQQVEILTGQTVFFAVVDAPGSRSPTSGFRPAELRVYSGLLSE